MKDGKPKDLNSVGDVLQGLFEKGNPRLAEDLKRFRLKSVWPQVVGGEIANHCYPKGFREGTLFLCVKGSVAMNQLLYLRTQIIEKVNEYLGINWVKELKFSLSERLDSAGRELK